MSEWIKHKGGKCPVPDGTIVDVVYRDGTVVRNVPANINAPQLADASSAFWHDDNMLGDIMKYRLVE